MLSGSAGRRWARPILLPLERRLTRAGANPVDAPLWLLGIVLVLGLLAISLVGWVAGSIALFTSMRGAGAAPWVRLILGSAISLVTLAIVVRVIGSWVGFGRFTKWMRPAYLLSDWIVEPIRRRLPAFGVIDLSPFVAYLALLLLKSVLFSYLP